MKKIPLRTALKLPLKVLFICLVFILFAGKANAQYTFTWNGNGTDWSTTGNWTRSGFNFFQTENYPGQNLTNDIVQIGTSNYTTNQPVLATALGNPIATLTFGANNSVPVTLTINSGFTLTVNGAITQNHKGSSGGSTTTIAGLGILKCNVFTVGDNTAPGSSTNSTIVNSTISTLNITTVLKLNSAATSNNKVNNPVFNLSGGNMSVTSITTTDDNFRNGNTCKFNQTGTSVNSLTLNGPTPFSSLTTDATIDFVAGGTTTNSTVIYNGTAAQTVYSSADARFNTLPTMYPNLTFSGVFQKNVDANSITIGGDWNTSGGAVNLVNALTDPAVTVAGDWNNSASVTQGTGTIGITGDVNNDNGGVINEGTATVTISGDLNNGQTAISSVNGNTAANTTSVTGALNNGAFGTVTVNAEAMTFGLASTNTGTYTGGTGASKFTVGLTNTKTITANTGTFTIGNFANNTPGTFTGYNTAAATTTITGTLSNTGIITVNKENIAVTGTTANSGTYDATTGTGASNFNGGLTNTGPVKAGTGTITVTTFNNNSPGAFTGSASTGAMNVTTLANGTTATITVAKENITYSGAVTNAGTYTGGTGTTTTGLSIFNGTFTNNTGGTFNTGTSDITFNNSYTNTGLGVFTAIAGTVIFAGSSAQALLDNSTSANGTAFNSLQFSGNNTKTMTGPKGFSVGGAGTLTLLGTSTSLATGGVLTLKSISGSSAIVDIIPPGCTITGTATVERFIRGGAANKRGYRLITSTVYTGTDATAGNVFDLQYLPNTVFVSGTNGVANGFNVTTTNNPSLYLFREDETPPPSINTVFTTGYNWKGVAKLTGLTPAYATGTQAKGTTTNIFNSTVLLPVGNGVLFFFRGDKSTSANYTAPFGTPQDVTLKQTGTLNTGTISVKLWYNYANGTAFTFTAGSVVTGPARPSAGYALIGNPYPSTINWEKFNNTTFLGAISQTGGLASTIYFFDPTSKQYQSYIPKANNTNGTTEYTAGVSGGGTAIGKASNFIASGQGFFIKASATGQTLTFTEQAKVLAQPASATTLALMGRPKELATAPVPLLRLKMVKDTDNDDEIVVRLDNKANAKYVEGEDALDLDGDGALETLSTFSSDNMRLAIDFRPFPGKQDVVVPLKTGAPASGAFQLNMTELDDLPSLYTVWLKDAFTSDSVQMKAGTSYPFNIDKTDSATFGANRFTLVIRQDTANAYRLLDFTANRVDNSQNVELDWKTANEENYTNFTVERSNDGGNTFNVAGGKQGTGAGTYSLVDKNAQRGENLYRLKQEDVNNTISYSDLVKIFIGNHDDDKIHIYPNPAVNFINLDFSAKVRGNGAYEILVTNSSGTVVRYGSSTDAYWQTGISNLHPGTYLVHVINRRDRKLIGKAKFIKL